jgi:hypothetical protein
MTIKLFEKIKKIIDEISLSSPIINNQKQKEIIYYNCYLVSNEIRNGFYPEFFNNIDEKILNKIRKITNLDYIKCACYDNSRTNDTIYIYNKNKYDSIKKSIEYLNKTKRTDKNTLKIDSNIANLLSYDKIKRNYDEAYDEKKTLGISFIIFDFRDRKNMKKIKILEYQSYKSNLIKNYEKLQRINNLPIFDRYKGLRCKLEIDDVGM